MLDSNCSNGKFGYCDVLLARRYVDIQNKIDIMAEKSKGIGLDVNIDKTKALRMNARVIQPIHLYEENIDREFGGIYIPRLNYVYRWNFRCLNKGKIGKSKIYF